MNSSMLVKSDQRFGRTLSVVVFMAIVGIFVSPELVAQDKPASAETSANAKPERSGNYKVIMDYFADTRDFNNLTVYSMTNRLPWGFSVWGFSEFFSPQRDNRQRFDFNRSFSEYRLSNGKLGEAVGLEGLGAQAELNAFTTSGRDVVRLGLTYKHALPLPDIGSFGKKDGWLQWRAFPYETDEDGAQVSLIYNLPLHQRVSVTGFADLNINDHGTTRWIIEPSLNINFYEQFWFLTELRYNEFERRNSNLKGTGVAFGLRVVF